ncbi:uncharacterized protein CYBJADRAFT_169055 [Cyberlindnera jadinii NRRL Y-1542]|nr:hypothetical protein CYBJADRAFT_169055 [Cyberlindnera jadinii NRRL Y-1542]ODV72041.1 hypothetical protein CYBJADRAFT_169055 [Cyberlindnera jadinii NRRL Y-1542]
MNLKEQSNDKKRGPTTPLTPTLIQKNIVKKQYTSNEDISVKTIDLREANGENYRFNEDGSSPKSRRTSLCPTGLKTFQEQQNATPKISAGIKQAVRENKKSRLQILRGSANTGADVSVSESEYSEMSTISGETPNYKLNGNLVYYKNGYYLDSVDDSFAELEREALVNEKELQRVDDIVEFMKLERKYERENS